MPNDLLDEGSTRRPKRNIKGFENKEVIHGRSGIKISVVFDARHLSLDTSNITNYSMSLDHKSKGIPSIPNVIYDVNSVRVDD